MGMSKYIVEIEKPKEAKGGRPSVGPVYRNVLAKDGFRPLANGVDSCWDVFRYVHITIYALFLSCYFTSLL